MVLLYSVINEANGHDSQVFFIYLKFNAKFVKKARKNSGGQHK